MRNLCAAAIFAFFSAFAVCSTSDISAADGSAYLTLDGEVKTPLSLSEADFRKLPRITMEVSDSGGTKHTYEGVALSHLLTLAGVPLKDTLKGADITKFLHAQGRDGFGAVFALPEFDSGDFLVADTEDGSTIGEARGPLITVSPLETRRSRWIKQLQFLRVIKSTGR